MTQPRIYISLGWNCDPRGHIHRIGLTKANGYLTCPFDLSMTPFNSLCKCIEDDFKHFFDDLRLIPGQNADGDRSKCGAGGMNITNHYNMVFNHEGSTHSHLFKNGKNDDLFYIRNDFGEFRKRYENRIQNYKKYINRYNNIIFVYKKHDNDYDLKKLYKLLKEKYINKNIKIIEL